MHDSTLRYVRMAIVAGFALTLASENADAGGFKIIYSFQGGNDGANPYAGLVHDTQGNLYGTTTIGGFYGLGTVFKLDAAGNLTLLYSFTGGADGGIPHGNLILDAAGNLYGTALISGLDHGVVFKITP